MNTNDTTVIELTVEELQNDLEHVNDEVESALSAKPRQLDFTVVSGHLRGDHACPFELHATGCRDLNQLKKLGLWSFNVYAESREAAIPTALEELGGVAKVADIWVQPCCTLKRMKAIGRA